MPLRRRLLCITLDAAWWIADFGQAAFLGHDINEVFEGKLGPYLARKSETDMATIVSYLVLAGIAVGEEFRPRNWSVLKQEQ